MDSPIYRAALAEIDRLKRELLDSAMQQAFQDFLRAQDVVHMYAETATPLAVAARTVERQRLSPEAKARLKDTEAGRVIAGGADILRERGGRIMSGEMATLLGARGIKVGGKNKVAQAARVSAHLSAAKDVFDNVRGEGYGLKSHGGMPDDLLTAGTNGHAGAH